MATSNMGGIIIHSMKATYVLGLLAFITASCGPTAQEKQAEMKRLMDVAMGLGCSEEVAYNAARSQLRLELKHPDASDIDSLHEARIRVVGDSVHVTLSAMASNSYGVKDKVHFSADLICRHDSLFWVSGYLLAGDESGPADVEGKPVADEARLTWMKLRDVKRQKEREQELDSLKRVLGTD